MRFFNTHHRVFLPLSLGRLSVMLCIGIIAQGFVGCTDKKQSYPEAGEAFPLTVLNQLKKVDDNNIDLKNKTLLINLWATWCAPCRREMPDLQKLSEKLDQTKFAVIGISVDDDINLVKEFLLQYKIGFSNFQDENLAIAAKQLGIDAYPETFIISPTGITLMRISGEQSWDEDFFMNLLQNADQTRRETTGSRV
jgi:thiol-disulfide isomerase/thioredoxin